MVRQKPANAVKVHEDEPEIQLSESQVESDEGDTVMDESRGPENESGATHTDESEESELDESVAEDIARFEASFKGINKRYRLINRIGEGECWRYWWAVSIPNNIKVLSLPCTRLKICTTTTTKTSGISRRKKT